MFLQPQKYTKKLVERTNHHMGYPYNLDFDFGALEGLTKFSINNLGDPFIESNYGVHSREFEVGGYSAATGIAAALVAGLTLGSAALTHHMIT